MLAVCLLLPGCRAEDGLLLYLGRGRAAEYIQHASQITYPDLELPISEDVHFHVEPRTIRRLEQEEIWDLSLSECLFITLNNSEVIRNSASFLSPQNPILANPGFVPTIYDPAIQASGVLFGQRGVEAALSDFDTQFTTQLMFGNNETVQNNTLSVGLPAGETLKDETMSFSTSLQKRMATGGQLFLGHNWNYTARNIGSPPQLFPSVYEGNLLMQFRQPLLAGGGVEYTRVAGPISTNIQGVTGVQQGVIISRINNDMALAEFERDVHLLIHDVEVAYWQLHLAYRTYAIQVRAREQALEAWQLADYQTQAGTGFGAAQEAELRDTYLSLKNQADLARDAIYTAEAQLRLLMSLPVNDGRVIRPVDDPMTADFAPNWTQSLSDALALRPELRRQKWNIRSLDLQLRAAQNLNRPRLDFVSGYQINGYGDDLFDIGNGTATGRFDSYYEDLFSADQTGWNLGVEFSVPIGRRFAKAQVQSLEFALTKAQAVLEEQEVEISHEVAFVFREIDRAYVSMRNEYSRLAAARDRVQVAEAQFGNDPTRYPIGEVIRAQQALAQAELSFLTNLIEYNTAIADLYFRTGRTLVANNIQLMEGPWVSDALDDAHRQYKKRRYAHPTEEMHFEPAPVSAF